MIDGLLALKAIYNRCVLHNGIQEENILLDEAYTWGVINSAFIF
jgi:hypothetical protein